MSMGRSFLRSSLWIAIACAATVAWWMHSGTDRTPADATENMSLTTDAQPPLSMKHLWDFMAAGRH